MSLFLFLHVGQHDSVGSYHLLSASGETITYGDQHIPDDGLGFKGRNVGFCQQLINFIDDKSTDGWTMSNNTNTIINSQPRISLKLWRPAKGGRKGKF